MTITSKAVAKVAAVATGLAMATSMLSLAPIAHAACDVGTANLMVGSSGAAVTCLQQTLIAAGYSVPAGATGHFGAQTKAAVMAWQKAVGITPASGFFGPISRAALGGSTMSTGPTSTVAGCAAGAMYSATTGASCTAMTSTVAGCAAGAMFSATTGMSCTSTVMTYPAGCTSSVGFSSTTGTACSATTVSTGITGSGRLVNINSLGNLQTSIHEGDAISSVVGESADATGGDVSIQRVDATFTVGTLGSASVNLSNYMSDVSLWLNGVKIGDMNPSLATKTSGTRIWTLRFSGLNGVIKAGTTGQIYVKITPVTGIGSAESGNTVTAELTAGAIRAVSADGISDTYGNDITQNFTITSATVGTLTASAGSDNPNASVVAVSSSTTTGVKLLSFNLKATNQNVTVNSLQAAFQTSDNSLNDVVATVYLMQGSTVLSSKTLPSGVNNGTVTFTNVNQTITNNSTQNYTIVADLQGDANYVDGTTLTASTTVTGWDASDATGATVTPSSAVLGNTMSLTGNGIAIALGTPSATDNQCQLLGCGDVGNYAIPFTVTAGNSDLYVDAQTGAGHIAYATTSSSGKGVTNQGTANFTAGPQTGGGTSGDVAGVAYKVPANSARTFTLNVSYTATSTGYTGLQLTGVQYGLSSGSLTQTYTSNLSTFFTNNINLVKH